VGVLNAFISAWSNARSTFGEGAPQTGARYDSSGPLRAMQTTVQSAAPGLNWTGGAANAYGTANADHSEVLGKLAGLDQRLSAQVDQSAQVVDAGRRNLDAVRKWVLGAAAAVPPGKNREQMLLPIVKKGLTQLTEIVTKSNGELNRIGGQIRGIGGEYEALGNQRFAPKKGGGDDVLGVTGDDDKDKPKDQQAADDFKAVVDGTATPEQVQRVRAASTLTPEQVGTKRTSPPPWTRASTTISAA
jgi:EspA/EspE family